MSFRWGARVGSLGQILDCCLLASESAAVTSQTLSGDAHQSIKELEMCSQHEHQLRSVD